MLTTITTMSMCSQKQADVFFSLAWKYILCSLAKASDRATENSSRSACQAAPVSWRECEERSGPTTHKRKRRGGVSNCSEFLKYDTYWCQDAFCLPKLTLFLCFLSSPVVRLSAAGQGKHPQGPCQSTPGENSFLTWVGAINYSLSTWARHGSSSRRLIRPPRRCPSLNLPYLEPFQELLRLSHVPGLIFLKGKNYSCTSGWFKVLGTLETSVHFFSYGCYPRLHWECRQGALWCFSRRCLLGLVTAM